MPVRFETESVYDRSYPWHDSYLSTHFVPSPLQGAEYAGKPSVRLGITAEPAFQRKRRPVSLTRTSTTEFSPIPTQDDYILLGDQSKFAPSVRYRSKSQEGKRTRQAAPKIQPAPADVRDQATQTGKEHLRKDGGRSSDCPVHGSDSNPLSNKAGVRNQETQTERRHLRKAGGQSPDCPVHGSSPQSNKYGRYDQPVRSRKDELRAMSPPLAPRYDRPRESRSRTRPKEPIHPAPTRTQTSPARPKKPNQELPSREPAPKASKTAKAKFADVTPAGMPSGIIKEADAKKRAADELAMQRELAEFRRSEEVTQNGDDYVMRYRAGIAPSRHRGPKRRSEYEMQYGWKDAIKSSPLLAADQVVFKSSSSLVGPTKTGPTAKGSEYAHEFKSWTRPDAFRSPRSPRSDDALKDTPTKKQKMQRSKSMEAIRVDQMHPAGKPTVELSARSKRLVKSAINPLRPYFPHGKFKTYVSEYDMKFRSPTDYAYIDGAWKSENASRAQSAQAGESAGPSVTASKPAPTPAPTPAQDAQTPVTAASSWYSEVLELRQKANEYKQRARGTHFSRQHLAQLYAQQADLWDNVSNSSMLSALSLESAVARRPSQSEDIGDSASATGQNERVSPAQPAAEKQPVKKPKVKKAWQEEEGSTSRSSSVSKRSPAQEKADAESVTETYSIQSEGRVPTPKLKVGDWIHRHHLDRTTPAIGGALLTSPPKKTGNDSDSSSTPRVAASQPAARDQPSQVSHGNRLLNTSPIAAGKPTRDTHQLIDEEASTDRPLDLKYIHSPDNVARRLDFERRHPPHLNIPSTIKENTDTYHSRLKAVDDDNDDILSLSARSVASSCSLASEVLDRARNRRDEFWGRTMKNK